MTKELMIFENPKFGKVRSFQNEEGEWRFIGMDVAALFEYSNPAEAIRDHCKHAEMLLRNENSKKVFCSLAPTVSRILVISESDIYRLAFSSKSRLADQITDWLAIDALHKQLLDDPFLLYKHRRTRRKH